MDELPFSTEKSGLMEQVQDHQPTVGYFTGLSEKEIERGRRIGAANMGKAPWTKGRKLTKEHKQLIKQRTIHALRDPKVMSCKELLLNAIKSYYLAMDRELSWKNEALFVSFSFLNPRLGKKMGHRQLHRHVSKDKISAAQRKIWERRIVSVRSRQMTLWIWSNSIAEAAKEGGHVQDKLDWDSYEKLKSEMISIFLWNKEKERVTKKLKRAVTKIIAKKLRAAEKMEVQTRRRKKAKPEKLVLQKPAKAGGSIYKIKREANEVARSQKGTQDHDKFVGEERRRAMEASDGEAEGGGGASRGGPGEGARGLAEGAPLALQGWAPMRRHLT